MNFDLVWKRVEQDSRHEHFLRNRLEMDIIYKILEDWSQVIKKEIEEDKYVPKSNYICDVPKGHGLMRPGSQLRVSDNVYYTDLLTQAYDSIFAALKWSQKTVDFGHALSGDNSSVGWIKNGVNAWNEFREESIKHLDKGYPFVVIADITGYYENIQHQQLQSDLNDAGVSHELSRKIIKALQCWSVVNSKGIPQSCSASHILELYLNSVDQALQNMRLTHVRFVDDIYIFCASKAEAKQALTSLCYLMRMKGLSLNSSKTRIHDAQGARAEIDGANAVLDKVKKKLQDDDSVKDLTTYYFDEYGGRQEEEGMFVMKENPAPESIVAIETAFTNEFINKESGFNKTLFRFLLNRLGEVNNRLGITYCHDALEKHPEEVEVILKYYKKCGAFLEANDAIRDYFKSGEAVYDFQNHEIICWLTDSYNYVPTDLLNIFRDFAFNRKHPYYLRSAAILFVGKFGNKADLELLEQAYTETLDELEQAHIICSVAKMEVGKRNAFFGKVKLQSKYVACAIEIAKSKSVVVE